MLVFINANPLIIDYVNKKVLPLVERQGMKIIFVVNGWEGELPAVNQIVKIQNGEVKGFGDHDHWKGRSSELLPKYTVTSTDITSL